MIGSLIRRDPALRLFGRWAAVSILSGTVFANLGTAVGAARLASGQPVPPTLRLLTILVLWVPVAVYAVYAALEKRCHRIDLALPIPGRTLWLSHTLAVSAASPFWPRPPPSQRSRSGASGGSSVPKRPL
jgi:hypothetical protein